MLTIEWIIKQMWPWTTKPVLSRWGIFVAIAKYTLRSSQPRFEMHGQEGRTFYLEKKKKVHNEYDIWKCCYFSVNIIYHYLHLV